MSPYSDYLQNFVDDLNITVVDVKYYIYILNQT